MNDFDDTSEKTRVTDAVAIKPAESQQDVLVHIYPPGPNMGSSLWATVEKWEVFAHGKVHHSRTRSLK